MSKRKLRLIGNDEYLRDDFATVRFVDDIDQDNAFGPHTRREVQYHRLRGYLDDLVAISDANGTILLPHDTENAIIRFMDMNSWLTAICRTLALARDALEELQGNTSIISILSRPTHDDDDDDEDVIDPVSDRRNQISDLEHLLEKGLSVAWQSLLETKRRKTDENWNYRALGRSVVICNDSILVGTDDDDPMIRDPELLKLESLLQETAWIFFMRTLYEARKTSFSHHDRADTSEYVNLAYTIGETDLLIADVQYMQYTMLDAVMSYSLFLRSTYTYPFSLEMEKHERNLAVAIARLLSGPSSKPRIDYDMHRFTTTQATTHLSEPGEEGRRFGIKRKFFQFTDMLVFPTKLRISTLNMVRQHCRSGKDGTLRYPSPRTERGYRYWRSIAMRISQLNYMAMHIESGFFGNDFRNFTHQHIYQGELMENEVIRFSCERPGEEQDPSSILETLREKDYLDINGMANQPPSYFCANYLHAYLTWMRDRLGIEVAEFMKDVVKEVELEPFADLKPPTVGGKCPPLETSCWPPLLPSVDTINAGPSTHLHDRATNDDDTHIRKEVEFRPRTPYDNPAFFSYMYILNAWGRRASSRVYLYPDYVVTDLMYRSDQIQAMLLKIQNQNTAATPPYIIFIMQQCYIFYRGRYRFFPHFAEAIACYMALFVKGGHVESDTSEDIAEDDTTDSDVLSIRDPFLLRLQSSLYHTDSQRSESYNYAFTPHVRD